jgi:DNA-binding NtrC family response regulator
VLENDETLRTLLIDVLDEHGLAVTPCASRTQLQVLIQQDACDVAVVDPWGDSHSALSAAERQELVLLADSVPTILYTARSWATDADPEDLHLLAIVAKPGDVYALCDLARRSADVIYELRQLTTQLGTLSSRARESQSSAVERINESWALLQAVREKLGEAD